MFDTITFLTDFGLQDDFVGVCRGVMKRIARDAADPRRHARHRAAGGARRARSCSPARSRTCRRASISRSSIPGVGSERRAVAIRTAAGRVYVGPDNGLLMLAADRDGVEGGAQPHEPALPPRAGLEDVPRPRPLRARRGAPRGRRALRRPRRRGRPGDARPARAARAARDRRTASSCATVLDVDRFGNLGLNVSAERHRGARPRRRRPRRARLRAHAVLRRRRARPTPTRSRGELIVYEDSYGAWAIAINGGNASRAHRGRRRATRCGSAPV